MADEKKSRVKVDVPDEIPVIYANFALVRNTASEFYVDLAQSIPDTNKVKLQGRVIMTMQNGKMLANALNTHIAKYESEHGEIPMPQGGLADQLFKGRNQG